MSANKPDISQIKKYLAGELDARAMHELERQALSDPFLMDALEGYEHSGKNQQANLDELSGRLHQRTQLKKRTALWPAIGMAASVLLFIGIGAWWLLRQDRVEPTARQPVVVQSKPHELKHTEPAKTIESSGKELVLTRPQKHKVKKEVIQKPSLPVKEQPVFAAAPQSKKTSSNYGYFNDVDTSAKSNMLNDVVVVGYGAQRKVSVTGAVATIKADSLNLSTALAGRVAGVAIGPQKGRPGANPAIRIRGVSSLSGREPLYIVDGILADKVPDLKSTEIVSVNVLKDTATAAIYGSRAANGVVLITTKKGEQSKSKQISDNSKIMLTGQVVGRSDKLPLPGVQVVIDGTKTGVQTDADGRFALKVRKNDMLNFRFVGYEGQKVKVKNQDKLQVALKESQQALSEVVVVGYGTRYGITGEAHPAAGWSDFKKYLKDNARSPDGKTGVVKLKFIVNADNSLSDFEVKKSLSLAADRKAIELIKSGPAWRHNVSGEPEKVTVRVRFTE